MIMIPRILFCWVKIRKDEQSAKATGLVRKSRSRASAQPPVCDGSQASSRSRLIPADLSSSGSTAVYGRTTRFSAPEQKAGARPDRAALRFGGKELYAVKI